MSWEPRPPFDPTLLKVGTELRRVGVEPARGQWHAVRRGIWLPTDVWEGLAAEERHQAFTHATLLSSPGATPLVLAGHSAASMWRLPRIEPWPRHILVLDTEHTMGPSQFVRVRRAPPVPRTRTHGVLVTPPARTVIDLACTGTLDTALAAADNALARALCTREELRAEYDLLVPGSKGRGNAALVVDLADGLSGSPLESLSRLQMFRASFPPPLLQAEYRDRIGTMLTDFDWERLIGECDGHTKYRVPAGATPEQATQVLWDEKRREDRLRRFKPVARWTWSTARSTSALARLLMSHGLRPQPRSTWFELGSSRSS